MLLNKAIKTISDYCMKHDCNKCRLSDHGECFRYEVPCDWGKTMKERGEDNETD